MSERTRVLLALSGLIVGPMCWAISTQFNYAAASLACRSGISITAIAAFVLLAIAGAATYAAVPALARPVDSAQGGRPIAFLAAASAAISALSVLAILLQGAAGLIFTGCEQ